MLKNEIMSKVGMFSFIVGISIAVLLGIVEAWMSLDNKTLFTHDLQSNHRFLIQ